jgi:F0F1-type ATP synthase membrane subunit a
MVQRREVYFHVFHDIEMGELNEACLNCFWIMKFCPFHYVREPNHNINITFALALFTRAITYVTKKENNRPPNYTESAIKHLVHAFAYRDLSKEALMAIGKSLAG